MKQIYTKEIAYEGHSKFIELLYYIENERKSIDLTVKRHNLYIQGDIARERMFDFEALNQKKNQKSLSIEMDFEEHQDEDKSNRSMIKSAQQSSRSRRGAILKDPEEDVATYDDES